MSVRRRATGFVAEVDRLFEVMIIGVQSPNTASAMECRSAQKSNPEPSPVSTEVPPIAVHEGAEPDQ